MIRWIRNEQWTENHPPIAQTWPAPSFWLQPNVMHTLCYTGVKPAYRSGQLDFDMVPPLAAHPVEIEGFRFSVRFGDKSGGEISIYLSREIVIFWNPYSIRDIGRVQHTEKTSTQPLFRRQSSRIVHIQGGSHHSCRMLSRCPSPCIRHLSIIIIPHAMPSLGNESIAKFESSHRHSTLKSSLAEWRWWYAEELSFAEWGWWYAEELSCWMKMMIRWRALICWMS